MLGKKWLAVAGLVLGMGTAQAGTVVGGVVAGTLGLGAQLSYGLTDHLALRAMGAGFSTNLDFEADGGSDLAYDGNVDLLHGALLVDYHPFAGVFRLTAGVIVNDDTIDGEGRCMQLVCDLGDNEDILVRGDTLHASANYDPVSPYLGFGWGKSPGADGGLGVTADIGAFYLGHPDVNIDLSGPSSANPIARDAVDAEERDVQDDLDRLPIYPVVMLGITYAF